MLSFNHVLFASKLDSKTCTQTLRKVMDLAEIAHAKVTLLHVVKPILAAYNSPDLFESYDLEKALIAEAKAKLIKHAKEANFPMEQTIITNGNPAKTILDYADKLDCDLIVLNGNTHNVFGRLGSTADAIINRAKCNVFILRQAV